ncbi:MAG: peptidylprolyl isomerase [Gemmatimonadetes bacterium]|nr:peptidylprolyl isomerase [Gemmatimonadota bacterium]
MVDRVVAVVGDSIILQTDLEEDLLRLSLAAGQPLPEDPVLLERLRRQALQSKIEEYLLVQAAERDSVTVPAEEVEQRVERELEQRRNAFGGERALEQALRSERLTLAEFRDRLNRQYTRNLLVEAYVGKALRGRRAPPVGEAAIRNFWEAQRERLGQRPATISFKQVVVAPQPTDSARAAARRLAEEILNRLLKGEDFEQLARRYSDDPGTREKGGDLGWFRSGQMVPAFEEVAFAMRPGQISNIVETTFGLHLIKLEKARGAERQARHILIKPELTEADTERARALAEEVAAKVRAGEPLEDLGHRHGDASEDSVVGPHPRDQLPQPYATELAQATAGAVIGPFRLPAEAGTQKWAVVKVTEVVEAGEYTLDDPALRAQVRQQLEQQKLYEELVKELRQRTYVEIRL